MNIVMQHELENMMIGKILKSCNRSSQSLILYFLDKQVIKIIYEMKPKLHSENFIFKLAGVLYLMNRYINRIDRSYYFIFYEEPEFLTIQKQQFNNLAVENIDHFTSLPLSFDCLFQELTKEVSQCPEYYQIVQNIQNLIFDSEIPMPKIKKQTVAMYCQSPFQLFLSEMRFPSMWNEQMQEWEEKLKEYLQQRQQEYLKIFCMVSNKQGNETKQKILRMRYFSHSITRQNWQSQMIQNCELHNIMVFLMAIIDNLLQTYYCIIINHKDPLMKLIEFSLRYGIFRNTLIAMEQHLKPVIEKYNNIFGGSFSGLRINPSYSLWMGGMTKWNQKMGCFHGPLQLVYEYVVTIQRHKHLLVFIEKQSQQLPSIYNPICNAINQRDFIISFKESLYQNDGASIQAFFENNEDTYQIVAKDYLEYLLDASINQFSVHWTGSSYQHFPKESPYHHFDEHFLHYNQSYYADLAQIISEKIPIEIAPTILKKLLQVDLEYVSGEYVKPVTAKKILQQQISLIKAKNIMIDQSFLSENEEEKQPKLDFSYKDNLLNYFNEKSLIPESCPSSLEALFNPCCNISFKDTIKVAQVKMDESSSSNSNTDEEYISDEDNPIEKDQKPDSKTSEGEAKQT